MALMAAHGEITPMPDCAVFADTQAEPQSVYTWLDWLEKQLPFPVYRVTQGNLETESVRLRTSKKGNHYQKHSPPAFTAERGNPTGILMRQCTSDFKMAPIIKKYRELGGKKSGLVSYVGISLDEAIRMKPPREELRGWLTNRWPLVEIRKTRGHCIEWMASHGYPEPPRSSCVFCPYHSSKEWQRLKTEEPDEYARAVKYEQSLQACFSGVENFRGEVFLHREIRPLDEIDFTQREEQFDMFGSECEGVCGV